MAADRAADVGVLFITTARKDGGDLCVDNAAAAAGSLTVASSNAADRRMPSSANVRCIAVIAPGDTVLSVEAGTRSGLVALWYTVSVWHRFLASGTCSYERARAHLSVKLNNSFATPIDSSSALAPVAPPVLLAAPPAPPPPSSPPLPPPPPPTLVIDPPPADRPAPSVGAG